VSRHSIPVPPSPEAARAERFQLAFWMVAFALVAAGIVFVSIDRRLDAALARGQSQARIHIEHISKIRRGVRSTHVELLERWLAPLPARAERQRDILNRVDEVRRQTAKFTAEPALSTEEGAARRELAVSVARWSNRVERDIVVADGVAVVPELGAMNQDIDRAADRILDIDSQAASATDGRMAVLHRRQAIADVGAALVAMTLLALTLVWARAKSAAEKRLWRSERQREQNAEAAHLRAMFFAKLSHELRTPLVSIQGFAVVLRENHDPDRVRDYAGRIGREADELRQLIDNILDASKLESGHATFLMEDVSLLEVVTRCAERCEGLLASKPIVLTVEIAPELPKVRADVVKLQQVVTNLIANAVKFTAVGQIVIRARVEGSQVVLEVEDTGIGIPPGALDRIWMPFEQADATITRSHGGTGLGLAIVRGIVERLGGTVAVRSETGKGATFSVRLSCAEQKL
jgi:signal transduction histidine kinase